MWDGNLLDGKAIYERTRKQGPDGVGEVAISEGCLSIGRMAATKSISQALSGPPASPAGPLRCYVPSTSKDNNACLIVHDVSRNNPLTMSVTYLRSKKAGWYCGSHISVSHQHSGCLLGGFRVYRIS
ncbi:hypothetical protein CDAR_396141 [Caerostris darwini]|uniref:Uncharacterized protein n=1 Tax=Caerostris darwini TaxID=1538125 RepID=A0AAV4WMB3_9ARAC|nr:hypothetical protein CDAR_396141 [Caerostris darwini]